MKEIAGVSDRER